MTLGCWLLDVVFSMVNKLTIKANNCYLFIQSKFIKKYYKFIVY